MDDGPVWEEGRWDPLPSLTGDTRAEVCVVGLGGSGLSAVGWLLDAGVDVVGVDAGRVAGGAAGRNGGFLLAGLADFHHVAAAALGRERATALYRLTLAEMDRMETETPGAVRRQGSLRVAVDDAELADCETQRRAMASDGLPVEPYEGVEGRGLLFPRDGALQPLRRCRLLALRALARGARLHEQSPVADVRSGGVVLADGTTVRCDRVVVAVDGGLEVLLPELAGRVRTARVQMLATEPTADVSLPMPVYARYGYEFWQQLPDGRIALGGGRDHGGDAEWTAELRPSGRVQDHLEQLLRGRLGVRARVTHRWAGAVGYGRSVLPVLEEVRPGVVAVGAYRGTGNVVGAIWGRAAAELAVTGSVADGDVGAPEPPG